MASELCGWTPFSICRWTDASNVPGQAPGGSQFCLYNDYKKSIKVGMRRPQTIRPPAHCVGWLHKAILLPTGLSAALEVKDHSRMSNDRYSGIYIYPKGCWRLHWVTGIYWAGPISVIKTAAKIGKPHLTEKVPMEPDMDSWPMTSDMTSGDT